MSAPIRNSPSPQPGETPATLTDEMKALNDAMHRTVEKSPFMAALLGEQLTETHYLQYLVDMGAIFSGIELTVSGEWANFLRPFYRSKTIEDDCQALGKAKPAPSEQAEEYHRHLLNLEDSSSILAHAYVQYLALLFGGQMQKRHIEKQWPGVTAFYNFEKAQTTYDLKGIKLANHFKDWLNHLPITSKEREAMLTESKTAFEFMEKILFAYDMVDVEKKKAEGLKKKGEAAFMTALIQAAIADD